LNWPHWSIPVLILLYAVLNTWGVKLFARFNSFITAFKFIVPALTVIVLLAYGTSAHDNLHFSDFGGLHNILTAVVAGGIVYGFNGVQMIVNFTSEAKRPKIDVPLALFLSLGIGLLLYLALQAAFFNSADLSINYQSPFVELVAALNMGWMVVLLQAGAAISPSGTGFSYMASSTRMLTAMSHVGQLPQFFSRLHPVYHISHRSLVANTLLSLLFFLIFKTWLGLVVVVSSFHLLSYLAGPVALAKLRRTMPDNERIFKMRFAPVLCPLLFVIISILFSMAGAHNNLMITIICVFFQTVYLLLNYRGKALLAGAVRSAYLPLWLVALTILAYLGTGLWISVIVALVLYYLSIYWKQ